jgi:hypothetical protein
LTQKLACQRLDLIRPRRIEAIETSDGSIGV